MGGLLGGILGGGGIGAGIGQIAQQMQQSLQTQMQLNALQMEYNRQKEILDMQSNIENSKHQALEQIAQKLGNS
jgi:hypothetical protein